MIGLLEHLGPVPRALMVATVLVGLVLASIGLFNRTTDGGKTMALVGTPPTPTTAALPPLDSAAPAQSETATFALG
ncbi:MAG: hypothetical protein GX605_00020 [Chloroflexi bacterium]|nr:hypothetical protein [Chloroflexota bacterium]